MVYIEYCKVFKKKKNLSKQITYKKKSITQQPPNSATNQHIITNHGHELIIQNKKLPNSFELLQDSGKKIYNNSMRYYQTL